MKYFLIILLFPAICFSSTDTIKTIEPIVEQMVLMNIKHLSYDAQISSITYMLKNNEGIDKQILHNERTYLKVLSRHEKQGRNYIGHIEHTTYKE